MEIATGTRHRWVVSDINEETIQSIREFAVTYNVRLSTIIDLAIRHWDTCGAAQDISFDELADADDK